MDISRVILLLILATVMAQGKSPMETLVEQQKADAGETVTVGEKVKATRENRMISAETVAATRRFDAKTKEIVTKWKDGKETREAVKLSAVATARVSPPAADPQPPPGKHSKDYLQGFSDGVKATKKGKGK